MITLNLSVQDKLITVSPKSVTVNNAVCNESLQHMESKADCTLVWQQNIFEVLIAQTKIPAVLKDGDTYLFTGIIQTDMSWRDIGKPYPVDTLSVTINDNTVLFDKKTKSELALINTDLRTIVATLCEHCGVSLSATHGGLPAKAVQAFVADEGKSYKELLGDVLFSYGYSYYFDAQGKLCVFNFAAAVDLNAVPKIDDMVLAGEVQIQKSNKRYTGVKIGYNTLTEKKNELVYFSGNGYGSTNEAQPAVIQPGVYYPFESAPQVETTEGQVWQSFEAGFAETYKKYNGETDYRRSKKTSLLYTQNHHLVQDWSAGVVIERTVFEAKRASVRLQNKGTQDAKVYQLSIRADAWYRNAEAAVTVGKDDNPYSCQSEFIYNALDAEHLAKALSVYMLLGQYQITTTSDTAITLGIIQKIDCGISGFSLEALSYSSTFDAEKALWTTKWISAAEPAIDVKRFKSLGHDDTAGALNAAAENAKKIDELANGSDTVPPPDTPINLKAVAQKEGLHLSCVPIGGGLRNSVAKIIWEIKKTPSGSWQREESAATEILYRFNRGSDGYPEASTLALWRVRAKTENIYGKQSVVWAGGDTGIAVDTSQYGTWLLQAPIVNPSVSHRFVSFAFGQPPHADNKDVYGTITHTIQIRKPAIDSTNTWYKPATSVDPYASENNYKEGAGTVTAGSSYTQTLPLTGQNAQSPAPQNTLYQFKVIAQNEAGQSAETVINVTATNTNIRDIVKGWYLNEQTGEKIKVDGALGAEHIYTEKLSAIAANMGFITGGTFGGNELNHWALTRVKLPDGKIRYEGSMRVGGVDEYLQVVPIVRNGIVQRYEIKFKVGNFEVTSQSSNINGDLYIQAHEQSLERTKITPSGIFFEHRNSPSDSWAVVNQFTTSGVKTPTVYSDNHLIITNKDMAQRRKSGSDIGCVLPQGALVYHYDTDIYDQTGADTLPVLHIPKAGRIAPELRGSDDSSAQSSAVQDFTPAILACAPYSTVAKMLYGNFALEKSLGVTNTFTVDFWLKYFWNESQEMFRLGTNNEYVSVQLTNREPYYNEVAAGDVLYNEAIASAQEVVYNEIADAKKQIVYKSAAGETREDLSFYGVEFLEGKWTHVGIIGEENTVAVLFDKTKIAFTKNAAFASDVVLSCNKTQGLFCVDELMIAKDTAIPETQFLQNTEERVPWGSLDYTKKWFVLDADKTIFCNLFESEEFKQAVRKALQP